MRGLISLTLPPAKPFSDSSLMRPVGFFTFTMISSQASIQAVQPMQSSWSPCLISIAVGHTAMQRLQSTQSPLPITLSLPRGSPRLTSYPTSTVS